MPGMGTLPARGVERRGRPASGWLFNIQAQPEVEIQVGRVTTPATATVVNAGDPGYARLWKAVNDNNHGRYDGYQARRPGLFRSWW